MIAAILAGGRSRRMGSDKALVEFHGEPLIARPIAAARAAGLEPVAVAKARLPLDVPTWLDRFQTSHPLSGLLTALEHGPVVALACDQPLLTPGLLAELAAQDGFAIACDGEPFPGADPRLVVSLNTPQEIARWT